MRCTGKLEKGDVTGVHGSGSPTVRRRELGALLRAHRVEKGWTAEQVADRLMMSTSKVSRLETGQRGASARDVNDLCDLYEVDDEQRRHLQELASEGKQRAWWQPLGLPYSTYVGLGGGMLINDDGLGIIPGLLQAPDYARAVVHSTVHNWPPQEVTKRVQGRMIRQQLLFSEHPPNFDVVVDESVLHRIVGSKAIMRAQLERLLELSELPAVTLRVLPFAAGVVPASNNKFIILKFASPSISDIVFIECLSGDLYLEDPDDIEVYNATFKRLINLAASPGESKKIIEAKLLDYGT